MTQENLRVSERGQITLPARLRKALGIREGDVLALEEDYGKLVLKPRLMLDIDWYDDNQSSAWDRDDQLPDAERRRLEAELRKMPAAC